MQLRLVELGVAGLAAVTLSVEAGECVSLEGASGTGKTRLLRAVADLDPHDGEVYLDGVACGSLSGPAWRRRVALLPAEVMWWKPTARDHFASDAAPPTAALDLDATILRKPLRELSTGQRQRLALLRLVQHTPQALLLDEPTAALDASNVARVEAFVEQYRERHAAPVIWVGHDREQLTRVASRHFAIRDGALTQLSAPPSR